MRRAAVRILPALAGLWCAGALAPLGPDIIEGASTTLPPELQAARAQVIEIARANTTRTDNVAAVRARLTPHVLQLARWYADHRPAEEVAWTQVPWRNLWYDDPDIGFRVDFGILTVELDRSQIYQVIEDGYYYNVSEVDVTLFFVPFELQGFLKGAYDVIRPADDSNEGEGRLNVVDLEFVASSFLFGPLPRGADLRELVDDVETGELATLSSPGPIGVTGELWNVYLDEELRIAVGFDDSEPDVIDLYVLERATVVGE